MSELLNSRIERINSFLSLKGVQFCCYTFPSIESKDLVVDKNEALFKFLNTSIDVKGNKNSSQRILTWFVEKDDLVESETTRTCENEIDEEACITILGLGNYSDSQDTLVLLCNAKELFILNASKLDIEKLANDRSSPVNELIEMFSSQHEEILDDRFCEWNKRLLESFFSEASRDEEVFMRTDPDFLDSLGQDIGGDAGFLEAVKNGPSWLGSNLSLTQKISYLVKQRAKPETGYRDPEEYAKNYRNLRAPSYLPYLAALVRRSCLHGSFYDGINSDLELSHEFSSQEMDRIGGVWEDLHSWTKANHGKFGLFNVRVLGGYRHIGIPRSQAILTAGDVDSLPIAFVQSQLRPGTDLTEEHLTNVLEFVTESANLFSAGFKKAIENEDLLPPVYATLEALYSDWDGTLPPRQNRGQRGESYTQNNAFLSVCLLFNKDASELVPSWQTFVNSLDGSLQIDHNGITWKNDILVTRSSMLTSTSENQFHQFWQILEKAAEEDIGLSCDFLDENEIKTKSTTITLPKSPLWVFVPKSNPISRNIELHASELPASGFAFLLSPPSKTRSLANYLERTSPSYQIVSHKGIPSDWLFVRLEQCESLTDDQRNIPDGRLNLQRPRAIRFEGGRSIRRGYSTMYLPYDLPIVELDAPWNVILESPDGVSLTQLISEEKDHSNNLFNINPIRTYLIELRNNRSGSYEIIALDDTKNVFAKARLRISGMGGEVIESADELHINRFGRAIKSQYGLKGPHLNDMSVSEDASFQTLSILDRDSSSLGNQVIDIDQKFTVSELFLDSLAQSGSMNYGAARDQMIRLSERVQSTENPIKLIIELQKLGHLEISRTDKGHIAKIHAIPPSVYSVPQKCEGRSVWMVGGTLRLKNWEVLEGNKEYWDTFRCASGAKTRALTMIVKDLKEAKNCLKELGFQFSNLPCRNILAWAADLTEFREESFKLLMESIGREQDSVMRLNPEKGYFFSAPSAGKFYELWRIRDRDTGVDNVYVLADKGKYTFIRDREWGVWVALQDFTNWVKTACNLSDMIPIITYQKYTHTLWIPERIRPPFILDRVLHLSAGSPPEVFFVKGEELEDRRRYRILEYSTEICLVTVDAFYKEMTSGKWLAYRMIPKEIATELAKKLGAKLDIV